ncbi:MAG: flagellar biosynthesis protein FlhF [Rhodothermales bacterium]
MKVKTLTGPSIHAALIEARRLLGDDVVLLESIPAEGDSPARITVMVDVPAPAPRTKQAPVHAGMAESSTMQSAGYGYARGAQSGVGTLDHMVANAAAGSARNPANYSTQHANFSSGNQGVAGPGNRSSLMQPYSHGLAPVAKKERNAIYAPEASALPVKADQIQELLESQLQLIHNRLDRLDRKFEGAIIGSGIRWASHELYSKLLRQGMRPSTVTRFFEQLISKGFEPDHDPQKIRWALAQVIRNSLKMATPKRYSGTVMFIGPSGAGKTSLLLKSATHPSFFGRYKSTVISILPENSSDLPYQNPAELYARHGISVQTVQGIEEMNEALDRAVNYDQVLIDTPPMPVHEAGARKMLLYLKRLVEPLMPVQIHLVLNATRALEEFDSSYLQRLPLRTDAIAFTHLDETRSLGRIAEWIMQTKLPVQFASSSPKVPDGVGAFTPSWFVEEMMRIL